MPAAASLPSREYLLRLIAVVRKQNVALGRRCAGLEDGSCCWNRRNVRLTARVAELERPWTETEELQLPALAERVHHLVPHRLLDTRVPCGVINQYRYAA